MKAAKARREQLFRIGKPTIRPAVYNDIRWVWASVKRSGFEGTSEEFTQQMEPLLAEADRLFVLEDRNREFSKGTGPVGIVLANYDGWALVPHVQWFPWASHRNILRCSVGFLQAMRYTQDVGVIKIFADGDTAAWFKRLKRYVAISLGGRIPYGRDSGEECIFYLRGRKHHDRGHKNAVRRDQAKVQNIASHDSATAGHIA